MPLSPRVRTGAFLLCAANGIAAVLHAPFLAGDERPAVVLPLVASPPVELALAGDAYDAEMAAMLAAVFGAYRPNLLVGHADPADAELTERAPFLAGRPARDGKPTAYVCEQFACLAPVTDAASLAAMLERGDELVWQEI